MEIDLKLCLWRCRMNSFPASGISLLLHSVLSHILSSLDNLRRSFAQIGLLDGVFFLSTIENKCEKGKKMGPGTIQLPLWTNSCWPPRQNTDHCRRKLSKWTFCRRFKGKVRAGSQMAQKCPSSPSSRISCWFIPRNKEEQLIKNQSSQLSETWPQYHIIRSRIY